MPKSLRISALIPSGHLLPEGEGLATYFFANLDTYASREGISGS